MTVAYYGYEPIEEQTFADYMEETWGTGHKIARLCVASML